jgi:hypothetical protein
MCYAYYLTRQDKYLESVIETVDYVFGKNATGFCFVTGFGKKSPLQPHHRIMAADGVEAPFPGFLVGVQMLTDRMRYLENQECIILIKSRQRHTLTEWLRMPATRWQLTGMPYWYLF